jgi:hypothetical protein
VDLRNREVERECVKSNAKPLGPGQKHSGATGAVDTCGAVLGIFDAIPADSFFGSNRRIFLFAT